MSWRAIDELRPSFEATKSLLFPFDLRRWLVLAVIVFFVSGASGANPDISTTAWDAPPEEAPVFEPPIISEPPILPEIGLAWILFAFGFVLAIGLVLLLLGAIMEFVFVRVVTDRDIRLRGYVSENVRNGVSLFLFRIAIGLGVLALVALPAIVLFLLSPILLVLLAIVLVPILVLVAIGLWVVLRFTADFVVPIMVLEDVGILEAWGKLWPALVADWKQYGVYALARIFLGIVASVLAGFGFVVIGIVLGIPFGIIAAAVYLVFEVLLGMLTIAIVSLIGLGVLYLILVFIAGITFVQVPIQTYLRYYSLFVLGSVTPPFDMVAPLRPMETDVDEVSESNGSESGDSEDT
ncbi:hypothetical protein OB919_11060 [Halobacteria archaeon AArc-curdl1]|uniref:Uncharacterized protein n=1 Tax=Natronosalvus hydrolyticus TaxID=2979988 RepID=A0AAP2Z892_9EURY|nr:hypothetical protein [Halobacteria archaeon AArc-curdl1]